jgi:sulfopyruvate decarboxylase alpha subunit
MTNAYAWAPDDWQKDVFDALKALDVRHVAYVPDAGHASLIEACHADPQMTAYVMTTEEEGIGVLAGADLGGERGVLLMQSSGVGNCPNGFTLIENCGFPFLALITMRGEWSEFNPWQIPMGRETRRLFEGSGIQVHRVEAPDRVGETVRAVGNTVFDCASAAAILLSQRLIGAKVF